MQAPAREERVGVTNHKGKLVGRARRPDVIRDGALKAPLLAQERTGALSNIAGDRALEGAALWGGDAERPEGEQRACIRDARVAKGQDNDIRASFGAGAVRVLAQDAPAGRA